MIHGALIKYSKRVHNPYSKRKQKHNKRIYTTEYQLHKQRHLFTCFHKKVYVLSFLATLWLPRIK